MSASVRVMRSYDYCHFEVSMDAPEGATLEQINETRKQAALLVDEAVRQYQIAKAMETQRASKEWEKERAIENAERIRRKPQSEWSATDAAFMRGFESHEFWKDMEQYDYGYCDNPEREEHFSMLRKFGNTRISAA